MAQPAAASQRQAGSNSELRELRLVTDHVLTKELILSQFKSHNVTLEDLPLEVLRTAFKSAILGGLFEASRSRNDNPQSAHTAGEQSSTHGSPTRNSTRNSTVADSDARHFPNASIEADSLADPTADSDTVAPGMQSPEARRQRSATIGDPSQSQVLSRRESKRFAEFPRNFIREYFTNDDGTPDHMRTPGAVGLMGFDFNARARVSWEVDQVAGLHSYAWGPTEDRILLVGWAGSLPSPAEAERLADIEACRETLEETAGEKIGVPRSPERLHGIYVARRQLAALTEGSSAAGMGGEPSIIGSYYAKGLPIGPKWQPFQAKDWPLELEIHETARPDIHRAAIRGKSVRGEMFLSRDKRKLSEYLATISLYQYPDIRHDGVDYWENYHVEQVDPSTHHSGTRVKHESDPGEYQPPPAKRPRLLHSAGTCLAAAAANGGGGSSSSAGGTAANDDSNRFFVHWTGSTNSGKVRGTHRGAIWFSKAENYATFLGRIGFQTGKGGQASITGYKVSDNPAETYPSLTKVHGGANDR